MNKLSIIVDEETLEVSVPSSWDEISIGVYADIQKLLNEDLTLIERSVRILSIVSGVDEDMFWMMSPNEFQSVGDMISFMNEEVEKKQTESILIGGDEFFVKNDFDNLTMGEMISMELLIEESNGNILSKLPEMLCIFLRKKKENGKLESFKKEHMARAEMLRDISISDVNHLFFAFSTGENSLEESMKDYLESQRKRY